MTTPHKNSERVPHIYKDLIIAWANGAEVQFKTRDETVWREIREPHWVRSYEYRIKPVTKIIHFALYDNGRSTVYGPDSNYVNTVKATFDDRGNLLTVEKVSE